MTTLSIITPSCQPEAERLEAGVRALEEAGFRVKVGEAAYEARAHTVDEDRRRAKEFEEALVDPESEAVLCARGGYGVARLLDFVNWERVARSTKRFCGYSDITTLHAILEKKVPGLSRAYGPMAACRMLEERSPRCEQLFRFLRGEPLGDILAGQAAEECTVLRSGRAEGLVTGGCLCLVVSTLGTPYEIDTEGKILILEDINEESRRVDRYLTQLLHAGKLDRVAGVVTGQTFCLPTEENPMGTQEEILRRYLEPLKVPVLMNAPIGHVDELMTVPLTSRAVLDTAGPSLTFESP